MTASYFTEMTDLLKEICSDIILHNPDWMPWETADDSKCIRTQGYQNYGIISEDI